MTNASIDLTASAEFVSRVPISFARRFALIGLAGEDAEVIRVAVCDDGGLNRSDAVGRISSGKQIKTVAIPAFEIRGSNSLSLKSGSER